MNELLDYLKKQREEKFTFNGKNHYDLVGQCLTYIGDPDGEIRDHIVYPALAHLLHDKHLNNDQLKSITRRLIGDEFLLYDLENKQDWSVLTRSFTLLQLAILVFVHNRDTVFDEELARDVFNRFLTYIRKESVYTGYDETVGWAHAIAHSGDLMNQLIQMKELSREDVLILMDVVYELFTQDKYIFISDEDERIVTMIAQAYRLQKLTDSDIEEWVKKLHQTTLPKTFPENYYVKQNILHISRSLFFRLEEQLPAGTVYRALKDACKNRR